MGGQHHHLTYQVDPLAAKGEGGMEASQVILEISHHHYLKCRHSAPLAWQHEEDPPHQSPELEIEWNWEPLKVRKLLVTMGQFLVRLPGDPMGFLEAIDPGVAHQGHLPWLPVSLRPSNQR